VFLTGLAAALSGIYFLFFPDGYQGGKNPWYDATILFTRSAWSVIHIWGGVLMIIAAIIHIAIHWSWITMMSARVIKALCGQDARMSRGAKINLAVDATIAICFVLLALSGIYFLFAPSGGYQGGHNPNWNATFLFSRTTWDVIHTWAGTIMIIAALIHVAIHWRWVTKVTVKFFQSLLPQPAARRAIITRS
jgi:cytochrome b subunit of formate dehydrogenase